MTKKIAAAHVYYVAQLIRERMGGDEDADIWVLLLEGLAHDLDPQKRRYIEEPYLREPRVARQVKLRRLIDHPATPQFEREAAVRALARVGERQET